MSTMETETPNLENLWVIENFDPVVRKNMFDNMSGWLRKINPEIAKLSEVQPDVVTEGRIEHDLEIAA